MHSINDLDKNVDKSKTNGKANQMKKNNEVYTSLEAIEGNIPVDK